MAKSILVNMIPPLEQQLYEPQYLSVDQGHIIGCDISQDLSYYLGSCSKDQFDERIAPIREAMDKYNSVVRALWEIRGFKEFFTDHNYVISREDISGRFGDEAAELAFSLQSPPSCYPDLIVFENMFQLRRTGFRGEFVFKDEKYTFDINGRAESYPEKIDNKICFWNWDENKTDYALDFTKYVEERLPKSVSIFTDPLYQFDYYDQWRGEIYPIVEAINEIFASMEERGYLSKYILKAGQYKSVWNYYTGTDSGTVGLYLCDPKVFKDKLLVDRINALLKACSIQYDNEDNPVYGILVDKDTKWPELSQKHYYLQDENDKTYLSKHPGMLGGHYKLKIYGRLDCPSAARHLAKGQYVRYRVFFENEETAINAGYRPCGVCMKEAYRKWKDKEMNMSARMNTSGVED